MSRKRVVPFTLLMLGLLLPAPGLSQDYTALVEDMGYADTILVNGKIVSMDDRSIVPNTPGNIFEAMAIKGKRIMALGTQEQMQRLAGSRTQTIDMGQRTVIPGLIQTHYHPACACVNGASIPKAFWSFIGGPLSGKYVEASIVHDYYCRTKSRSWQDTHRAFYQAMRARGVSLTKATVMYQAVQKFGPRWETVAVKGKPRLVTGRSFIYYSLIDELAKLANQKSLSQLQLSEFLTRSEKLAKLKSSLHTPLPLNCSVLIPELSNGHFSGSLVVCDNSKEKIRLVALQNIRNLQRTLMGVRSANSRFLTVFDNYIAKPNSDNWRKVVETTTTTRQVVSKAMRAWFKANDMPSPDPGNLMNRINHLLASRTAILGDLMISGKPPSRQKAFDQFDRYTQLAAKLRDILRNWEVELEEKLGTS